MSTTSADLAAVGKAIWWMILIRGIVAILFGILALVFPDATLVALALLFGIYSIIDGVTAIAHAIRIRQRAKSWVWLLVQGILSLLAGIVAVLLPVLTGFLVGLVVVYVIAFWSIFTGIAGFPAAHAMADGTRKMWGYVAAALSVVFGVALLVIATINPAGAITALIWVIGAYAIVAGLLLILLAVAARSGARKLSTAAM